MACKGLYLHIQSVHVCVYASVLLIVTRGTVGELRATSLPYCSYSILSWESVLLKEKVLLSVWSILLLLTLCSDIVAVWSTVCATQEGSPCHYHIVEHNNSSDRLASKSIHPPKTQVQTDS